MIRILVSACLLGRPVRYDGRHKRLDHPRFNRWESEGLLISFCPETAGGLSVPRTPAAIVGGDGEAVLEGRASVMTRSGENVTDAFIRGAAAALAEARLHQVALAIFTEKSPSCGSTVISDGIFSGKVRPGRGVAAALLEKSGIRVFNPHQIDKAARYLERLAQLGPAPLSGGKA
jgi:uncharacterized protein YbbK (DUF523 family)